MRRSLQFSACTFYTCPVTTEKILAEIDAEIARLMQARALLSGGGVRKSPAAPVRKRRKMSAAARKRIGDAQRLRWSKQGPYKQSDK
jgi:hypothetical protein